MDVEFWISYDKEIQIELQEKTKVWNSSELVLVLLDRLTVQVN